MPLSLRTEISLPIAHVKKVRVIPMAYVCIGPTIHNIVTFPHTTQPHKPTSLYGKVFVIPTERIDKQKLHLKSLNLLCLLL